MGIEVQASCGIFGSASTFTQKPCTSQPNVPTLPPFPSYPMGANQAAAASCTPDVDPPGVTRAFQNAPAPICFKQAAISSSVCMPRPAAPPMIEPYMKTTSISGSSAITSSSHELLSAVHVEEKPPGVGEMPSVAAISSGKAPATHLQHFSQPCGGDSMPSFPSVPYGGIASRYLAPSYSFCSQLPRPPPLPSLPPPPPPTLPPPPPPPPGHRFPPQMPRKLILPDKEKVSLFVGKIVPSLSDEFLTSILELCGSIRSWTRAKDPATGSLKSFGFCEYESPESLLRALRLLNRLKLEGQELMLKVDQTALTHLEHYVDEKIKRLKAQIGTEFESAPGLEAASAVKQLTFDVPREVPVEERLGWVCEKENEIDNKVCKKLVNLLKQGDRMDSLHLPSIVANTELDKAETDEEYEQGSPTDENWQSVKLSEWKQFEYALERCKLKVQGARGTHRSSVSYYLEFEKLWEERERAKENQRNMERERAEAARKKRQKLLKIQEESSESHKRVCYEEKTKKRLREREEDNNDRIREGQKGELLQNRFPDLSTRAKIALCFKSSSKQRPLQQFRMPIVGGDSFWGEDECFGEGHKQERPLVSSVHYRNPTFTWERESTPEERSPDANKSSSMHVEKPSVILEKKTALDAKELIDSLPRTKNEIFSFCMDWSKFDEHCLHERIRPWVSKKISEFLGEEEETLVDFIVTSAKKHMTPTHLLELLENIFVEEAELFVVKLWRMVIYELRKVECGFSGG